MAALRFQTQCQQLKETPGFSGSVCQCPEAMGRTWSHMVTQVTQSTLHWTPVVLYGNQPACMKPPAPPQPLGP